MAATISAHGDRVAIALDSMQRDILIEPLIARNTADALDIHATLASVSQHRGPRDRMPSVDVESVLAGDNPRVRIKFGRPIKVLYLHSLVATELAQLIRTAAVDAERKAPCYQSQSILTPPQPRIGPG